MQIGIDRELFRKAFRKNNKGENVDAKIASEKGKECGMLHNTL